MKGKVDVIPWDKFTKFGAYAGLDLSTTTDLSAYVILSEPDELGDRMQSFICPKDTIEKRSKRTVFHINWADMGYIIATPGNVIDYDIIEETINTTYHLHKVIRLEYDRYNATQLIQGCKSKALMFPNFRKP
jgi:phage terminase large subunit-like protein